jgi:hypothetical protein
MIELLQVWYWQYRMRLARQYRANAEHIMRLEIAKAQYDLDHCTTQLARAEMARVETRANRRAA